LEERWLCHAEGIRAATRDAPSATGPQHISGAVTISIGTDFTLDTVTARIGTT
jgi:hypothetical protein